MRILFLWFPLLLVHSVLAQDKNVISGYIRDKASGEDLPGATVYVQETKSGTVTNAYGFYSLSHASSDSLTIIYSFIGYNTIIKKIKPTKSLKLNIDLQLTSEALEEVNVVAESQRSKLESTQMSKITLGMDQVKDIPALLGEVDVLKVIQFLPGIQSGSEGTTGYYVRGGGADQNLILLDEAVVYNASHLFGFFSVFNQDAIKNFDIFKGGYPSKYAGRLSSVLDIKLKEGNKNKFEGAGGIGIIASRLTLEGPVVKGKSSFIVSGRRTYIDPFIRAYNNSRKDQPNVDPIPEYYFYDLNTKINYTLGEKDRLFLSGYFGKDVFNFIDNNFNFNFNWGNATGTARWNHLFTDKLFLNTSLIYSNYNYSITNSFDVFNFELGSNIRDINLKTDFDYLLSDKHTIRFGAQYIYHAFTPSRLQFGQTDSAAILDQEQNLFGNEGGLYVSDDIKINALLKVNLGARYSVFKSKERWYHGVEPRASFRYKLGENSSIKGSYTRMYQYIHLVSGSGASLPTDIWYPSTENVAPQIADQVAGGITTLVKDKVLITTELFYKWLHNQVDFKDGAQLFVNSDLDNEFVFGRGWSYGGELLVEKKQGKFTGWIGYTLSWSHRQFDEINNGEPFFPRFDRRHDISTVINYKINEKYSLTAAWVYGTGNATTIPIGKYIVTDADGFPFQSVVPVYGKRNDYRLPAYHRLDLGFKINFFHQQKTFLESSDLSINFYNAYNTRNPFFLYVDQRIDPQTNVVTGLSPKILSLFPIIPSVTWNFKF